MLDAEELQAIRERHYEPSGCPGECFYCVELDTDLDQVQVMPFPCDAARLLAHAEAQREEIARLREALQEIGGRDWVDDPWLQIKVRQALALAGEGQ